MFQVYMWEESATKKSHVTVIDLLEPGDQIMADGGFDTEDDVPTGVTLNIHHS